MNTVAQPPQSDGKQPGSGRTSSSVPVQAAPIRTPQASSSQAAGQLASNAGDCVPPSLFDPAFLAAWRESQGQPIDAEPRG